MLVIISILVIIAPLLYYLYTISPVYYVSTLTACIIRIYHNDTSMDSMRNKYVFLSLFVFFILLKKNTKREKINFFCEVYIILYIYICNVCTEKVTLLINVNVIFLINTNAHSMHVFKALYYKCENKMLYIYMSQLKFYIYIYCFNYLFFKGM